MSETAATDLQLLARYTQNRAEDAFAELVRRHVDLVHSAALRQVRSPQLAEEVAQSVFADLARAGTKLKPDTILTAWLYQVTRRTAIEVVRREARRQLREQIATEMNALNASGTGCQPVWSDLEPLLDEAMSALDETGRAAVLLRYFENRSLRDVGRQLGVSDDAAQKRVSRAVERLREFFAKHGVSIGAGGLASVLSANAVHAAPAGLAVTISTTAALAGTVVATTATGTAAKAIAMTTLQKTLVTATLAVLAGVGIYETRQVSQLREQVQALQHQQAPLGEQIQQLERERDDAARQLATLRDANAQLNANSLELLRLRGEVGVLRKEHAQFQATTQLTARAESTNAPLLVTGISFTRIGRPREVSDEQIRTNIQLKIGDDFDRGAVDRDIRNLYATGWFQQLQAKEERGGGGVLVNYALQERPTLIGIQFSGNTSLPDAELGKEITVKVGDKLDEKIVSQDVQNIEARYKARGFPAVKGMYQLEVNEDTGEATVTFQVRE